MDKYLISLPAVFVSAENYDIIFLTHVKGLAWVTIGDKKICDSDNGNIKSEETAHKITVSKKLLDEAGSYTVYFAPIIKRTPYFPTMGETVSREFKFYPVLKKETYNFYMIADTHSDTYGALKTGTFFKENLDFLIMNGDIADKSKDVENISTLHIIAGEILKGEKPVIFARGNHDTRGELAPELCKYTPTPNGNTYFTFSLGNIWGVVLDCGEDKPDNHVEYGGMADFESFRIKETEFLENVVKDCEFEKYDTKMCICHVKFFEDCGQAAPEIYRRWTELLNEIGIDIMLCGHEHAYYTISAGSRAYDGLNAEFPVVVGSRCQGNHNTNYADLPHDFIGTAVTKSKNGFNIEFTDSAHNILEKHNF